MITSKSVRMVDQTQKARELRTTFPSWTAAFVYTPCNSVSLRYLALQWSVHTQGKTIDHDVNV